ncbi:MAG: ABC transporter substrate-binding protein [Lachnospiraceae bacterium]|nr:ABC transporter substrate-binding protein [Lachnospiraceae bacterium]
MKLKRAVALMMTAAISVTTVGCTSDKKDTDTTTTTAKQQSTDATTGSTEGGDTATSGELKYGDIKLGESYTDITTTIKFIHHKTDRDADGTIAAYIAKFNEVYPNIKVETAAITDYASDALLRLSTGDWGDIMFIPAIDKSELSTYFIPFGTTEEMDQYINFPKNWELDGNCYGIGYMGNAQGLLYNSKVFNDAGVTTLPKTPDEFIDALKKIKENTDAIPLYTNYAAGWTMGAWDSYMGGITEGDSSWLNQKFVHTANPFENKGDGTGAYALYKILYDAVSEGLIEDDYTTTDWEGCKGMLNRGEIGCMVLGSWAVAQMKAAGDNPQDIGYMPFPITVNGTQYATAGPDYCYGINANSSDDNKKASMVFVKWMVEESGWCEFEGGYPISKTAPTTFDFSAATIIENDPALPGEEDFMNEMNSESELSFNAGGDKKVQAIIEAAATGSESFDDIMADWTQKWNDAQSTLNIEVKY